MTSSKILATSLLSLLVAGCSNGQQPAPTPGPSSTPSSEKLTTAGAARVHGDLMPSQLLPIAIPKPTELALLHGSDALAPRQVFTLETPAEPVTGRDYRRTLTTRDTASLTFPVDAPVGAMVLVRAVDGSPLTSVHMHDLATGRRIDHARDASNTRPVERPGSPLREPGFAPLLDSRQLGFDEPMQPGLVQLDIPKGVAAAGIVVEVQQPNSPVTLSAVPGELAYENGDTAELTFTVASGTTPVDGATVTAWAEYPDHAHSPALSITPVGKGVYSARVPLSGSDHLGTWGIHVKATGTTGGLAFERDVETAFAYYPSHAQMTALGKPVVTRGADGLVDEVSVDVDVSSLADDRFSVRGTLTFTGADGLEHPLASAQTGQTVSAGASTITLHFTSDALALAGVDGPFHLRDVALVSQAFGITQHRIGRALDIQTAPVKALEIRYPAEVSIQAQDLIDNGDLPPRRKL
jgi:hypothetical protein